MNSIQEYLTQSHDKCDELFAMTEERASTSLQSAKEVCAEFIAETERHFQMEERVMFVAFENKTGMTQGPTAMMRHEHTQMRTLMQQMQEALAAENKDKFFGFSETLMMLIQQHNMKEVQMLYPMAQQHLSEDSQKIVEMMHSMISQ